MLDVFALQCCPVTFEAQLGYCLPKEKSDVHGEAAFVENNVTITPTSSQFQEISPSTSTYSTYILLQAHQTTGFNLNPGPRIKSIQ